jgi:hypothetical protein
VCRLQCNDAPIDDAQAADIPLLELRSGDNVAPDEEAATGDKTNMSILIVLGFIAAVWTVAQASQFAREGGRYRSRATSDDDKKKDILVPAPNDPIWTGSWL